MGGADAGKFAIDGSSGVLTFASAPDFETAADDGQDNIYDVVVRASDGSLFDDQTLAVTVTNVNAAPVFTSGGTGTLPENAPTTTVVYDANATDDNENTGTLTYSLLSGGDAILFNIDSVTGQVRFNSSPDFEAPIDTGGNNVYDFVVQTSDGTLSTSKNVAITVTNVADTESTGAGANNNSEQQADIVTLQSAGTTGSLTHYEGQVSGSSTGNDNDYFRFVTLTNANIAVTTGDYIELDLNGAGNVELWWAADPAKPQASVLVASAPADSDYLKYTVDLAHQGGTYFAKVITASGGAYALDVDFWV